MSQGFQDSREGTYSCQNYLLALRRDNSLLKMAQLALHIQNSSVDLFGLWVGLVTFCPASGCWQLSLPFVVSSSVVSMLVSVQTGNFNADNI